VFIARSTTGCEDHVESGVHVLITQAMNPTVSQYIPHRLGSG
jgi:hypothetical protein